MPHSSPHYLRQQHQRLFTSSMRDSGVEHLTHMDRLAATRLSPRTGIRDRPEINFRSNEIPQDERISLAAATKLRRECETEESRIRTENEFLMKRLEVHATVEDRRKHHVNLIPIEEKKPFAEQGSNIAAKRKESERIAVDNETLMFTMATMKPTVRNDAIRASVDKHNELVKRISKFRPAPRYAGEDLLVVPSASSGSSPRQKHHALLEDRTEWTSVSPHDVRRHRKETDRAVRSVFIRDDDEVLEEAAATQKLSDVRSRRLTWTELGKQKARIVPKPPPPLSSSAR